MLCRQIFVNKSDINTGKASVLMVKLIQVFRHIEKQRNHIYMENSALFESSIAWNLKHFILIASVNFATRPQSVPDISKKIK